MKRAVIALVLALAALALLISLALESRSLPVETHVAQYTIAGDLERLNDDFRALVDTLESAWQEQTPPGEGARALLERVAAQPQQLPESLFAMQGSASQEARLSNSHATFIAADRRRDGARRRADRRPNASTPPRSRSCASPAPTSSRRCATQGLDRQAADTFQLVVGTLDFAGKDASVRARRARAPARHARPRSARRRDAGRRRVLLNSVGTILTNKPLIESKLKQLVGTPVGDHAHGARHGGAGLVHDRRYAHRPGAADARRLCRRAAARRRLHRVPPARQLSRDQPRERRARGAQRIARAARRRRARRS